MFGGLDLLDSALLGVAALLGARIAWLDFRAGRFPLRLWGGLTAVGVAWCFKQGFWPAGLVPLGLGALILWGINRWVREVIGEGDLLLLLTTGLFVPLCELDRFLVLAGGLGVVLGLAFRLRPCKEGSLPHGAFPFSGALLLSMGLTLVLALR